MAFNVVDPLLAVRIAMYCVEKAAFSATLWDAWFSGKRTFLVQ
jgi:hypothetical protein